MFFRLLMESFRRQRRRKLLAGIAILLGTTAVTAMLALATTIGDRIHKELAVYGANIIVYPKADQLEVKVGGVSIKPASSSTYLKESDLAKLKTIFWANNITGVSPELSSDIRFGGELFRRNISVPLRGYWFNHDFNNFKTGAPALHPLWKLQGNWPQSQTDPHSDFQAVLGADLARRLGKNVGDQVTFPSDTDLGYTADPKVAKFSPSHERAPIKIVGIVTADNETDSEVLMALPDVQAIVMGNDNIGADPISRVEISARTKPEDAFARKDPDTLSPKDHEIWYCRPYANSIAYQIREAIPGAQAEQLRRVEQSEGNVLKRISGLMWLISAAALLAAGFAVSAAMATAILERRGEIGLMRSLGASKGAIALLFYAETGILAIFAGALGYLAGSGLAAWLGARIFRGDGGASEAILIPVLLPVVVALALAVVIGGSTPSIRAALRMNPSAILREDA
jgi:putative ABC transport system permease protein